MGVGGAVPWVSERSRVQVDLQAASSLWNLNARMGENHDIYQI